MRLSPTTYLRCKQLGPVLRGRTAYAELGRYAGPVLVISAAGDDYAADTLTTFPKAHTRGPTSVLRLSGADHGWELLQDQHTAQVEQAIDRFLRRALGGCPPCPNRAAHSRAS